MNLNINFPKWSLGMDKDHNYMCRHYKKYQKNNLHMEHNHIIKDLYKELVPNIMDYPP